MRTGQYVKRSVSSPGPTMRPGLTMRSYTAAVDAKPVLVAAANALREVDLEAVLIGNAGAPLRVATLTDIIKSKRAAARPQDLAVLPLLEQAREAAEQDAKSHTRRAPKGK
jgi:uncharacterized transporter YbjL